MDKKLPACACRSCLIRAGYRARFNVTANQVGAVICMLALAAIASALLACSSIRPAPSDPADLRPLRDDVLYDQCCNAAGEGCDVPILGSDC